MVRVAGRGCCLKAFRRLSASATFVESHGFIHDVVACLTTQLLCHIICRECGVVVVLGRSLSRLLIKAQHHTTVKCYPTIRFVFSTRSDR
jgi:hypothetical protein